MYNILANTVSRFSDRPEVVTKFSQMLSPKFCVKIRVENDQLD